MKEGTREGTSSWDLSRSLLAKQLHLLGKLGKNEYPSILDRREKDEKYRTSQTDIGSTQVTVKQMDELALTDGIHHAAKGPKERVI